MAYNEELGEFLRAKRAALTPEAAGLAADGPRRVSGLRRRELALLAGVSVDYYTRLEQGRPIVPSAAVLDAIAGALRLDMAERDYLHAVARHSPPRPRAAAAGQAVRLGLLALIDRLRDTPAFVLGRRTDVLLANRMARRLLADFPAMPARERNATRWIVLDEGARSLFGDGWADVAAYVAGTLRMDAARHPDDRRLAELVGELSIRSEHFRRWWAGQTVVEWGQGAKTLDHPVVGRLTLDTEAVTFPGDPDQTLIVFMGKPGSPSQHAPDLLAMT